MVGIDEGRKFRFRGDLYSLVSVCAMTIRCARNLAFS